MHRSNALLLFLTAAMSGCAGGPADSDPSGDDVTVVELLATAPSPFALQYAGRYVTDAGASGDVESIDLDRYGRYTIGFKGRAPREHGSWHAGATCKQTPLSINLTTRGRTSILEITSYDGHATLTRSHASTAFHAAKVVGPNESLCDDSGGSWTDDDVDPATGLYCLCNAGRVYLPSLGGCVL